MGRGWACVGVGLVSGKEEKGREKKKREGERREGKGKEEKGRGKKRREGERREGRGKKREKHLSAAGALPGGASTESPTGVRASGLNPFFFFSFRNPQCQSGATASSLILGVSCGSLR